MQFQTSPEAGIRVLNDVGVRFLLVGLHGIGGWMRKPRATDDVDVLVATRNHKKAVKVLLEAFPYLEAEDHEGDDRGYGTAKRRPC